MVLLNIFNVVCALNEVWHYQKSASMLIHLLPFSRLVREIGQKNVWRGVDLKWSVDAIALLQTVMEEAMTLLFELS